MTRGTERLIDFGAVLYVARSFRRIERGVGAAKIARWSPGPDSTYQGIDLFVCEHSASALLKCGHRRATYSVGGYGANHRIVSDCQENGIAQSVARSAASASAVASRAVLCVENIELQNLIRRDDLGVWSRELIKKEDPNVSRMEMSAGWTQRRRSDTSTYAPTSKTVAFSEMHTR